MSPEKAEVEVRALRAIDIHGHVGQYHGCKHSVMDGFYSGGPEVVRRRAEWARAARQAPLAAARASRPPPRAAAASHHSPAAPPARSGRG